MTMQFVQQIGTVKRHTVAKVWPCVVGDDVGATKYELEMREGRVGVGVLEVVPVGIMGDKRVAEGAKHLVRHKRVGEVERERIRARGGRRRVQEVV